MSLNHHKMNWKRWAVVRLEVFDRDGYRCVKCGRAGRLECDHVNPIAWGGLVYDKGNLQSLCRGCHIAKTRGERYKPISPAALKWRALVESRM